MVFSIVEVLQATNTASPAVTTSGSVLSTDVILFVHSVSTTNSAPTGPGGVTELAGLTATTAGTVLQTRLYWAVAAASTTYTFNRDTAGRNTLVAVVIRGLDTTAPFGAKDQVARATAESHTTPTINTTTGGDLLVGVWSARVFPTNNWTLDTAGYTEQIDAVGADGSTNCRVMVATNPTAAAAAGSYSATAHLNAADGEPALVALLEANPAPSGGQSAAVGTASETDSALPLGRLKTRTVATASEVDSALPIGRAKARTVATASETDTAVSLGRRKARSVALAAETDAALPITRGKRRTIGIAAETDEALPIVRAGNTRAVGTAAETDTALPLGRRKARLVGTAIETDTALPITPPAGPVAAGTMHPAARAAATATPAARAAPTLAAAVRGAPTMTGGAA